MLDLIGCLSGQRDLLLQADKFHIGAAALAAGSHQRPALPNDPNSVALDRDASDSLARQSRRNSAFLGSKTVIQYARRGIPLGLPRGKSRRSRD